jgi:hypothetical protein
MMCFDAKSLTFVGECAEKVGADHLHGGLEHALLDYVVCRLLLIQHVNYLDQALFLLFLQLLVFF